MMMMARCCPCSQDACWKPPRSNGTAVPQRRSPRPLAPACLTVRRLLRRCGLLRVLAAA
jgi:hypothetical protein